MGSASSDDAIRSISAWDSSGATRPARKATEEFGSLTFSEEV